jgi:hypothetical protein
MAVCLGLGLLIGGRRLEVRVPASA